MVKKLFLVVVLGLLPVAMKAMLSRQQLSPITGEQAALFERLKEKFIKEGNAEIRGDLKAIADKRSILSIRMSTNNNDSALDENHFHAIYQIFAADNERIKNFFNSECSWKKSWRTLRQELEESNTFLESIMKDSKLN